MQEPTKRVTPQAPKGVEDHEDALIVQGRRIRALHEIISRPDLSFDEQIDETLRLGCKMLGCENVRMGLYTRTQEA